LFAVTPVQAVAADDPVMLFASKLLTGDQNAAAGMILASVGVDLRMPAIEGKTAVSAQEFLGIVSKCSLFRLDNTADVSVYNPLPPAKLRITWDCMPKAYQVKVVAAGDKVIISDFSRTAIAPPAPPAGWKKPEGGQ
jgi:hypothetical protein